MNTANLIARFENELGKVNRPGMDKLLAYIRQSDFYTAPASTKYHLSCEGGLLQHSLNVLDALRGLLVENTEDGTYEYKVAGRVIEKIPADSVIIMALLHDICKTHFYTTSLRNVKNEQTGRWEKVPYYTVKDKMPLGHGDKSVMIIKQYISMTVKEMYAIWWHMGFADASDTRTLGSALDTYPIIWALHTADTLASHAMEEESGNQAPFVDPEPTSAGEWADQDTEPRFEEVQTYAAE